MQTTLSPGAYVKVFAALLILLAVTWSVGYVDLGAFNMIFALAIAVSKALLIMLLFMHVRTSSQIIRLAAGAGVAWLLILITLALTDYMTRS
jgi:cytochrome c oxidase subunit 4